jgi:hypothetical protein
MNTSIIPISDLAASHIGLACLWMCQNSIVQNKTMTGGQFSAEPRPAFLLQFCLILRLRFVDIRLSESIYSVSCTTR